MYPTKEMKHLRLQQLGLILLISFTQFAYAQEKDEEKKTTFSQVYGIHTGPMLPNQIPGMTEIMPVWGVHYAFGLRKGLLELGYANARAKGVMYNNASVSFRGDYSIEDMFALVYAGLDVHYYSPSGEPYQTRFGGHVGGGFAAHLGDLLWFRTDMKFNVNPGTALYIGFGLEWRLAGGNKEEGAEQAPQQ